MHAVVRIPGAQPWSAFGAGAQGRVGVVITHGFMTDPRSTRPLGQRLATRGYSVEVPLLPGHGTDLRDLARTRYRDWFDHLSRVTQHLHRACDHLVLVGSGVGGTLSLDLASRRADLVSGVVAINAPVTAAIGGSGPGRYLGRVVPYLPHRLMGRHRDDLGRVGITDVPRLLPTRALRSIDRELVRLRAGLRDLDQPVLVVRSRVDHVVDPRDADELLSLLGSSDIRELVCEDSYHVALLDQDAARVEQAVTSFVMDVSGR